MLAAFFVLLGFRMPRYSLARAGFFVLAIATRQYMVVFPLALVSCEGYHGMRAGDPDWWRRVLPDLIAAGSFIGWVAFFGGLGPNAGLVEHPRHTDRLGLVDPMLGLYFLTTVGIYFVVPEYVLYRRWGSARELLRGKSAFIALVLLVLFVLDPPIFGNLKQGLFGRACHHLPVPIRMTVFYFLAWIACVRFARMFLPFRVLLFRLVIILNAWSAWEKYALPVLVAFWLMRATGEIEEESAVREVAKTNNGTCRGD